MCNQRYLALAGLRSVGFLGAIDMRAGDAVPAPESADFLGGFCSKKDN